MKTATSDADRCEVLGPSDRRCILTRDHGGTHWTFPITLDYERTTPEERAKFRRYITGIEKP